MFPEWIRNVGLTVIALLATALAVLNYLEAIMEFSDF